ncbi:hypothetical protein [Micromonospora sp. WMMD1274]|uniref:hypothetical protein n=1 Tax=Micromonospora sp. WMMD1274 TaxID=3404116 RepID=UPI003B92EA80
MLDLGKHKLLPRACRPCRRKRRQWRRDYLTRAAPQDALRAMTMSTECRQQPPG